MKEEVLNQHETLNEGKYRLPKIVAHNFSGKKTTLIGVLYRPVEDRMYILRVVVLETRM